MYIARHITQGALDSSLVTFPVRFLVQGMALFRDSLAQWAPTKKDGSQNDQGVLDRDTASLIRD